MKLREIADVRGEYGGLSRLVLDYSLIMKQLVDEAKKPGFAEADWAPLAALVATETFERVGNFKEVMRWPDYIAFLTGWAKHATWEGLFRRVTEGPNRVFLELEECSEVGGHSNVVNSVSVYEFDAAGRIVHLDIYLQMVPPPAAMLQGYEGIEISA